MNAAVLKDAGLDYERGVKRFMGRASIYEKVLGKFLTDSSFARIRTARATGDTAQQLAAVHEFKGMCGNIAMDALYQAADSLVQLLRGAFSPAELDAAYARLEHEYEHACAAIRSAREV